MQIAKSELTSWIYKNTAFTTEQSREFVRWLNDEQQQIVIAALEGAYEAGHRRWRRSRIEGRMNHPEYQDGAYLFSPIGDDRPFAWIGNALLVAAVLIVGAAAYIWGTS